MKRRELILAELDELWVVYPGTRPYHLEEWIRFHVSGGEALNFRRGMVILPPCSTP
jgi:hypothetical protein